MQNYTLQWEVFEKQNTLVKLDLQPQVFTTV
jgi:hypothetical protein